MAKTEPLVRRLVVPIVIGCTLAACSSTPTTTDDTTTNEPSRSTTTTPTTPTTSGSTATFATTTTPATTVPVTEPSVVASATDGGVKLTAPPNLAVTMKPTVLTVSGLGTTPADEDVIADAHALGFTSDPVQDYLAFGGSPELPFVNVEGAQMCQFETRTSGSISHTYGYAIDVDPSTTPQDIATLAAAPLIDYYPDATIEENASEPDFPSEYTVLGTIDGDDDVWWRVTAQLLDGRGTAIVQYDAGRSRDPALVGRRLWPPAFEPLLDDLAAEVGLSGDATSEVGVYVDTKSSIGNTWRVSAGWDVPDADYDDVVASIKQQIDETWGLPWDEQFETQWNHKIVHPRLFHTTYYNVTVESRDYNGEAPPHIEIAISLVDR